MEYYTESELKKVFIHEVGHFTANLILFEEIGQYKPKGINITWDTKNQVLTGAVQAKNRTDMKPVKYYFNAVLYDFESVISTIYGCIFQSILFNLDDFTNCTSTLDGSSDYSFYKFAVHNYYLDISVIDGILQKHYEELKKTELRQKLLNFDLDYFFKETPFSLEYFISYDDLTKYEELITIKNIVKPLMLITYNELKPPHN
ncbi:hypothetical protein C1637_01205 [Chryseobacterium lactis]|uniref:Uncharacterized protein n=1 Tax=Chryseobacterium lactis TaxID=1241981 RepID=A0A3G6RQU7_CHRLC|nr:hypothetical protein [Chryseobacterium lactis]AZA81222.1 hypothetical protein EG342_04590 [Chryseobacterium lactis]AZB06223.1 hypothetical protein EG341_20715 [Chryseobacterium lactis]PNW15074.1 hypothetical protein C1637_01205 [Chryseobacterium lactis]